MTRWAGVLTPQANVLVATKTCRSSTSTSCQILTAHARQVLSYSHLLYALIQVIEEPHFHIAGYFLKV